MLHAIKTVFKRNYIHHEGVRNINIYLLRLLYVLMFFVLGKDTWGHILNHQDVWNPTDAVAWCLWAACASLAFLGILYPLKMIPLLLLEIFYKLLWLTIVAYPLWSNNQLVGSEAEGITYAFLSVILPIVAVPWKYTFMHYILNRKLAA